MATISNQFRQSILDTISVNIGSLLIYNPLLGKDYLITSEQVEMRKNLTFANIVNYEVLTTLKNEYKRFFPSSLNKKNTSSYSTIDFNAMFTSGEERIGPFTHIVTAYNLNPYINFGRGRGDNQGILIHIESVLDKITKQNPEKIEFYIEPFSSYSMFISINISSLMLVE